MGSTEIVEPHGEPTHPAMITKRFGKRQGLAHLALVASTTGAMVTLPHTRVDRCGAPQGEHMLQSGFAMHGSHLNVIHPTAAVALFDVPGGETLAPADDRTAAPSWGWIAPTEPLQQRRLIAGKRIGEDRRHVPGTQTVFGIAQHGQRLLISSLTHDERHDQLAVSGHCRMIPTAHRPLRVPQPSNVSAFFYVIPLLAKRHSPWGHALDVLIVDTLRARRHHARHLRAARCHRPAGRLGAQTAG
jgi:hypothetical protein